MLRELLEESGFIAILRGIRPAEAAGVAESLYAEGFRIVEVPLNTPLALDSIRLIRNTLPRDCMVGAGTVVVAEQICDVRKAEGQLIVMPHNDRTVIQAAIEADLEVLPGVATPNEAFVALAAGQTTLKFFPADHLGFASLKAWRAVLPTGTELVPVGGIQLENIEDFIKSGAIGFGLGSALYRPGLAARAVAQRARAFVKAWAAARRFRRVAAAQVVAEGNPLSPLRADTRLGGDLKNS